MDALFKQIFEHNFRFGMEGLGKKLDRENKRVASSSPPLGSLSGFDDAPSLRDDDDLYPDETGGESEETEYSTCSSVRCDPRKASQPRKQNSPGFATMDKVKDIVRKHGGNKIEVVWCDYVQGPKDDDVNSLLVNSIGCIIRTKVTICAGTWDDLPQPERQKLVDVLELYFQLDPHNTRIFDWLNQKAQEIFKDFKGRFSRHYKKYGPNEVPLDLRQRKPEWQFLCTHFSSPEFKRRSVANTANRKAKDQEHHSGRKPIVRRMQKHKNEGCDFPVIKSYKETYPPEGDPKAAEAVEKMERFAAELKNKQRAANPDVAEDELPQMEWSSNMEVLEYGVGTRHGKEIRGLGKGPVRELPTRGTSRTNARVIEERLHSAEERAVKAEAISEGLQQKMELQTEELTAVKEKLKEMAAMQEKLKEMDEMKQAMARMMSHVGMQPQGSTQQQSDDVHLDGGR